MPVVALALFAVFALLGFGWRSWLQYRRTGSTGFRGISGRVGSTEWFAGAGFVVAMAAAFFAPVLQMQVRLRRLASCTRRGFSSPESRWRWPVSP